MKKQLFAYYLRRHLKKLLSRREVQATRWEEVKAVAIVAQDRVITDVILREVLKYFADQGKLCQWLIYVHKKRQHNIKVTDSVITYSSADLNLLGIPKNKALHQFIARDYDMLIDISMIQKGQKKNHLEWILALSRAKFKIAFNYHPYWADFSVNMQEENDIISCLKNIVQQYKLFFK